MTMPCPRPWTRRAAVRQVLHPGPKGGKAPAGGPDVLRVRQAAEDADSAGQGGGDQQPVGLGFAGGGVTGPESFFGMI